MLDEQCPGEGVLHFLTRVLPSMAVLGHQWVPHLTSQAANVVQQRLIEICTRFSHVDFDTISQTFQLQNEAQAAA